MDVGEFLQSMTKDDIIKIMQYMYNASYKFGKDDIIIFESICHNSDSMKLYYYHNPRSNDSDDIGRRFYCFVCGVNGNIIDLLEELSGLDFNGALNVIEKATGLKLERGQRRTRGLNLGRRENTDLDFLSIHTKKKQSYKTLEVKYNDTILDCFSKEYPLEWYEEGIDPYSAEEFDIRYNSNGNQAIIPIRDIQGDLIGIRVRNFEEKAVERGFKYMPLSYRGQMYRFPTSNVMYGLYENQDRIRQSGKVFLFEGEKSILKTSSFYDGYGLSLAVYGSNLSVQHRDILLSLGVREVTICFDKEYCEQWYEDEFKDTKEQKLMFNYFKKLKKICKLLNNYFIVNIVIDFDNKLDLKDAPVDKGKEVFEELLRNKITIDDVDKDFQEYFGI